MKLRSLREDKEPRLMIIPMIDIIFFLLVFFMMSMLSMVVQRSIDLSLPQTATAKVNVQESVPVSITAGGDIYVEREKVSRADFRRRMEIEKTRNPELNVILRADAKSEHEVFVYVLDQVKSIGINRIGIATESRLDNKKDQ